MEDDDRKKVDEIFREALALPPDARERFLTERCANDVGLRTVVESRLRDHAAQELGTEASTKTGETPRRQAMPTRIGPYRILQRIGAGGMGEVYEAEQEEPIRRRVALKVIKRGMDTEQVIARFEAERQALALMDHTNVARVFDAGSTDEGRPYFAMEYVRGAPLTEHCDRHRLPIQERLALFVQVCNGIQHAHQKAVIHRDIKPSNILVSTHEGSPVPKIIDFGVAKAMGHPLTQRTLVTQLGQLVGTPSYMSPEQAEMTGENIDTRTDIYSLGAVLYELLAGAPPFDPRDLRKAGFEGILRILREQEPPRPSTRVESLGDDSETAALSRGTDPTRLTGRLRGDLDWITMKALEKDRTRRYASPSEFAADIDRYLHHQPVMAGPPSTGYRMGKFFLRHRVGVTLAAVAALLLLGFAGRERIQSQRIARERDRANQEAEAAERARAEAQARAEELELVTEFQASMLSGIDIKEMGQALVADLHEGVLESLEAEGASPQEVETALAVFDRTLRRVNSTDVALGLVDGHMLQRAVATIEEEFADQPLIQAALRQTVSITYRELGRYPPAVPLQEAALETRRRILGDDNAVTLESINEMGLLLHWMGRLEESLVYGRESLEGYRRVLGDDHPKTISSIENMAALLQGLGKLDEALPYAEEALEGFRLLFGDDHQETLISTNNMGSLLKSMGKLDEALPFYEKALEGRRRVLGHDHPHTLSSTNNLGNLLESMGRFDEALPYFKQTAEGCRRVLGDDHPNTLVTMNNLGTLLRSMGNLDEALPYLEETVEGCRRVLGDDHPQTLTSITNLGDLLNSMGKPEEAVALMSPAEAAARQTFTGGNIRRLGPFLLTLGQSRAATGSFLEAEADLNEAFAILNGLEKVKVKDRVKALAALIDLQDAWHAAEPGAGHDENAAEWRARLEELQAKPERASAAN